MRNIIIGIVLAGCCWFGWRYFQKPKVQAQVQAVEKAARDMKSGDTAPVHYVESLQKDVQKADAAQDKANEAIKQTQQGIDDALKESGQ